MGIIQNEEQDIKYREILKMEISLYSILRRILGELNLQVVDHGDRAAYMFLKISQYRGLPYDDYFCNMMMTSYAHDIGAYKTEKFLDLLNFDAQDTYEHCVYGYLFMKHFSPLKENAEILLYHHTNFCDRAKYTSRFLDDGILIHLLDRIDISNLENEDTADVILQIRNASGRKFNPKDVEDFIEADKKYGILEKLRDGTYKEDVKNYFDMPDICDKLLMPVVNMLSYEIDFKSEQTVIHTITTQLIARILGKCVGLSYSRLTELECAAGLHDLGKIKIPSKIVEKPGRLTPEEYEVMKKHVVYTELIVGDIFPREVVSIASNHHERLDGSGYPKGIDVRQLSIEDRILQVADVTSALMQKRSYKKALEQSEVVGILRQEAGAGRLDKEIVDILTDNYDEISNYVWEQSNETISRYENMKVDYKKYLSVNGDGSN